MTLREPAPTAREERMGALAARLRHPDPSQLLFMVAEVAGEECYLRHGVTLEPGATVLDVGANVGVFAVWAATQRAAGRVHCFEPVPANVAVLEENVAGMEACVVHPYGLGARPRDGAELTYYAGAAAMSSLHADPARDRAVVRRAMANAGVDDAVADAQVARQFVPERVEVELRRLSDVLREEAINRVDLLKVDVERAELEVLDGLDDADWPRIGQVAMEVHDEPGRVDEVRGRLERAGLAVHVDQDAAMRGTDVLMLHAVRP